MGEVVSSVRTVDLAGTSRERQASALTFAYRTSPFKSRLGSAPELREHILSATLRLQRAESPALLEQMKRWLEQRAATQPLDHPSAGSFFKNPPDDNAGRLIEAAGMKGHRQGGAQVSTKHANFILNEGGASARDLEELIAHLRASVQRVHGIDLQPEVRIVGEAA